MNRTSPIRRAIGVLAVLADKGQEMTVNEIAIEMGLAPSTVHRLVSLLQDDGLVRKNEELRRYGVGGELFRLSARVQRQVSVVDVARPVLDSLARDFGELALLGWYSPEDRRFSFVAASDLGGSRTFRELNTSLLLFRGAAGKVILAHLPDDEYLETMSEAEKHPEVSGTDLVRQVEQVHQDGYLSTKNERVRGASGIAAPVFGVEDRIVGCICLVVPLTSGEESGLLQELAIAVRDQAARLSYLLGASGPRMGRKTPTAGDPLVSMGI